MPNDFDEEANEAMREQRAQRMRRKQDLLLLAIAEAGNDGTTLRELADVSDDDGNALGIVAAREAVDQLPEGLVHRELGTGELTRYVAGAELVAPDLWLFEG
jgi:hypothetical protein